MRHVWIHIIHFQECETGEAPPIIDSTCSTEELACDSGQCIPAEFFCDCIYDCLDGSDEMHCSKFFVVVVILEVP